MIGCLNNGFTWKENSIVFTIEMTRWMEKLKDQGSRINEIDIINMGIKYGKCIETAISESHTRKKIKKVAFDMF